LLGNEIYNKSGIHPADKIKVTAQGKWSLPGYEGDSV